MEWFFWLKIINICKHISIMKTNQRARACGTKAPTSSENSCFSCRVFFCPAEFFIHFHLQIFFPSFPQQPHVRQKSKLCFVKLIGFILDLARKAAIGLWVDAGVEKIATDSSPQWKFTRSCPVLLGKWWEKALWKFWTNFRFLKHFFRSKQS